jgi:succinate dehydrogenase / fumarate reductase iron-sulfur subunit
MELKFKISRYDPAVDQAPRFQNYLVEAAPTDRILDCLNRISWEQDGTIAYRMSCAHGVCGSDALKINGRCALACQKLVKDYGEREEIVLEPLPGFKVLKDLIVDMGLFLERVRLIRPYLMSASPPPDKERIQDPEDSKRLDKVIRCILCACCTGACPVMHKNGEFLGPATLVWAFRYIFDSRDEEQVKRLEQLDYPDGAWACENKFECTRVCPKEIPVTKGINTIKAEIKKALGKNES